MYYFTNSSNQSGFLFPAAYLLRNDHGAMPVYYSMSSGSQGKAYFQGNNHSMAVLQTFYINTYAGENYSSAQEQVIDNRTGDKVRYLRQNSGHNYSDVDSYRIYQHNVGQIFGTDT